MHQPRAARTHSRICLAAAAGLMLAATLASCVAREQYRGGEKTDTPASGGHASGGTGPLVIAGQPTEVAGTDDGPTNTGAECATSAACAPPLPYCDAGAGRCVECLTSRNCGGTGRGLCNTNTFACVHCLGDKDCTSAAPYCATDIGECVECLTSQNCGDDQLACDRSAYRCVPQCETHQDCEQAAGTPWCDPDRSLCVACLNDDDCGAPTPHCSEQRKLCVQCRTSADCQASAPCIAGTCGSAK